MKKAICMLLAACMVTVLFTGCSLGSPEPVQEASAEEIPTIYRTQDEWKERWQVAEFHPNEEITGKYDENLAAVCSNGTFADTVVYGTIWTAEEDNNGMAEAFAVKDGKFIYVGDKEGVKDYIDEKNTEIIDKTGAGLIIPGCTEGHGHFFGIDAVMKMLPGFYMDYDELTELIRTEYNAGSIDRFFSYGLNILAMEADEKNSNRCFAEELEEIAPGIPVVLIDNSAHSAMCNITALKQAGLWDSQDLRGGKFMKTEDGRINGIVMDQALPFIIDKVIGTMLSPDEYRAACMIAISNLHERGFTNFFDAWLNFADDSSLYKYIKEADEKGYLTINIGTCYNIRSYESDKYKEAVDHVYDLASEYQSEHFNPFYIKLFADGVVESRTGWMKGEYHYVEPGEEHGNQVWEPEEIEKITEYANSKGITIHTHTYGDAACEAVVDAYIESNKALGKNYRNGLGHVRNITDDTLQKIAENGISVAENLIWHSSGSAMTEDLKAFYPEGVFEHGYPMKSFLDKGINLSSSTDSPCGEVIEGTVMNIIEVATTGMDYQEEGNYPAYWPEELLTVEEALKCLTINGAWQLGLEEERGSIKTGKYADYTIMDKNILEYTGKQLQEIHKVKINDIYFEGEKVY